MTSVVLPQLKRTMTDIMDEELYQIPTSPLIPTTSLPQLNSATSQSNFYLQPQSSQPQQQNYVNSNNLSLNINNSYNHHSSNKNSVNSSPSLQQSQLYYNNNNNLNNNNMYNNMNNNSQNNLGDMLNIPDSFIEQFTTQYYADYLKSQQQQQQLHHQQMQYSEYPESQDMSNPFNNYSNSNSYIKPTQSYPFQQQENSPPPPLPQAFPTRRRRRITTIDNLEPSSTKKKNIDEDYLLYNPDISPGHVITENEIDSCFYVPPNEHGNGFIDATTQEFENDIIPGFENDYLYLDDCNEQIEEELSDDEDENEESYYHVDEEFDDYIMSNSGFVINNNQTFDEFKNISLEDNHVTNLNNGLPHELQELHDEAIAANNHAIISEVSPQSIISTPPPMDSPEQINDEQIIKQEESEEDSMMIDTDQDYHESEVSEQQSESSNNQDNHYHPQPPKQEASTSVFTKRSHNKGQGAEISATNPDHRCTLISPSTGTICNKQFSRPYDLIRHQNTIHASMKKIFRCVICEGRYKGGLGNGKEKTFSRGDALSRHIKIKHELVGEEALEIINEAKKNVEYHPVSNI
ncbi:RPN4 [Candida jiufengensis]|uniref:RPN4 n=1 Tax=Candida jiufengensis TaxID=497108 RepID=UPI002225995D|nr:RPN4 [Candida jiufengensis]KAI5953373.1 RPN4 [Candida jiufengensis]